MNDKGELEWRQHQIQIQKDIRKEGIAFANGCIGINCPCRKWISCPKYNSNIWKSIHPDQFNTDIHNWYDIHFHINYQYPDTFGNG